MKPTAKHNERIASMTFASVYPQYVNKIEKKGRTVDELNQVIEWLTGYDELKIKCQPVAINSGLVWPKNGPLKANKKLTVSILEPINPNLDEKNFLELVQKRIYEELDNLN